MKLEKKAIRRRIRGWAGVLLSGAVTLGWIQSCDDRLIQATRIVDPCGTILANCAPGQLAAQQAHYGDPCYLCPIPGTCGEENPYLNICN